MKTKKAYFLIFIMALVNSGIYGIIYMRNVFYNIMQSAMGFTHVQMGASWSIFGIIAAASYFLGGLIADRFHPKKLITLSLAGVSITGLFYLTLPAYPLMICTYIAFGIFSVLTYYPVSIKVVNTIGDETGMSGRMFGLYSMFVFVVNIISSGLCIRFAAMFPDDERLLFRIAILVYEILVVVALFMFVRFFNLNIPFRADNNKSFLEDTKLVLMDPKVRLIGVMLFSNYIVICGLYYLTPYLSNVRHLPETAILLVNMIRGEILGAFISLGAGAVSDRIGSVLKYICITGVLAGVFIFFFIGSELSGMGIAAGIACMMGASLMAAGGKSVVMAAVPEAGIPTVTSGKAVGIIAFIGFLPDAFFSYAAGNIIDTVGSAGYHIIFLICGIFALISSILAHLLRSGGQKL